MVEIHYDSNLVIASIFIAFLASYLAISVEQLLFQKFYKNYRKMIITISGMILGFAVWSMHLVGTLAGHLPQDFYFDPALTFLSYLIAAIASIFSIRLTTRPTLPLARLLTGAILMGLGMSGMHYVGMMGLIIPGYHLHYDLFLVVVSVLTAIAGAALAFWLTFKYKIAQSNHHVALKMMVTLIMAMSIVAMHYLGMGAAYYHPEMAEVVSVLSPYQLSKGLLLFTIIVIASLIVLMALAVASLELRLEQRDFQLSEVSKELATQALQDNLTKLPNRLFLLDYAQMLFQQHQACAQKIAWLYIDLDRFKSINDAFGHSAGDQLLVQIANRIQRHLTAQQKLLRIGGDEFLLVVEQTDADGASVLAERVLQHLQDGFLIAGKEIKISASIGIAIYPEHGTQLQDLLMHADAAMLMSKEQGRNTHSVFHSTLEQQESHSQSKLMNDLYKAVEEEQFVLFYQPKFTTDYRICGVEALIRWKHPTLGLLTPNLFIQGAEKTGLIIRMGYWALEQACKQIQQWQRLGKPFYPIAVNLSAIQFEHKHLFTTLEKLLKQYQVQPQHLVIEITESTAMHHIELSIRSFERLRQMGLRIAIDDFGTGHSSFMYLKRLPVDELKIDRGFINELKPGSKDEMILESIIHLALKLGLTVTAEGVETPLQADILTRLGCKQLQGFLLGMPVDVERLDMYLAETDTGAYPLLQSS